MKVILLSVLFLFNSYLFCQVTPGTFEGEFVVEYVWSKSKNEYVFLEKNKMEVKIVLTEKAIFFQKGADAQWLQNIWTFEKRDKKEGKIISDTYLDERQQKVVIDYESSSISYYYNWDVHNKTYSNIAVYSVTKADYDLSIDQLVQSKPERFTRIYNRVAIYDVATDKWSPWNVGDNTFVINANNDGDIVHYMGSGKTAIYKTTSKVRDDETDGNEYQVIDAVDDEGIEMSFQIFNNDKFGIKLIYKNVIFQFSKQ